MTYTVVTTHEDGAVRKWTTTDLAAACRAVLNGREDGDGSERFEVRHADGRPVTRGEARRAGVRA